MNNYKYFFSLVTLYLLFTLPGCRDLFGGGSEPLPISVNEDSFPATIEITTPQYASAWKPGDTMPIQWVTSASIEKISIELYRKSTFQFKLIERKVNDGLYYWKIPEAINHSVHYRIKIINHHKPEENMISRSFAITN